MTWQDVAGHPEQPLSARQASKEARSSKENQSTSRDLLSHTRPPPRPVGGSLQCLLAGPLDALVSDYLISSLLTFRGSQHLLCTDLSNTPVSSERPRGGRGGRGHG